MKLLSLILTVLLSTPAFASTLSERRAADLVTLLSSEPVRALLQQEDGVGNLESVSFVPSITEESNYLLKFSAYTPSGVATCLVPATLYKTNVTLRAASCKTRELFPTNPEPVCKNPSPIGCLD